MGALFAKFKYVKKGMYCYSGTVKFEVMISHKTNVLRKHVQDVNIEKSNHL